MDDYKKHLDTPGIRNWLKGYMAVNIVKLRLAPFACQVCDSIRVEELKTALQKLFPDLCGNCSIVEAIPCDPTNTICNAGKCRFHNGRDFRPCLIVKCNNYRYTFREKIIKRLDIGVICQSCSTQEIVHCNPRNKVCNSGRCKFHHDPNTKQLILYRPCLKNICDTLRNAIEHTHRFGNPSWKNTDTRKWCVNAWDIAKCFMPPDGYADIDNEDDTDLNGIISVFINCEEIQQYFTADLSNLQNICVKVREVGKRLRHAPGLDVTDADLKNWFSDLKALFRDPTFNSTCPNAQNAIDQLEQLENDDLKIEQAEYIAAMEDQVNCLKRLSSSSDHEALDDIRNQIGILENKIKDISRQGVREANGIDMEDFILDLKKSLIKYHRENNSTLTLGPFFELDDAKFEDFYVPPKIVKIKPSTINKVNEGHGYSTKAIKTLDMLFDSKQIVVITADAGVGKTSFCQGINYDNMEDIIFSHAKLVHTGLQKTNPTFDEMLSKEKGLIFLDGLDESVLSSINPLPANRKYTVVLTMRTWKLANITLPSKRSYQNVQIELMDETASRKLVSHANECLNRHFGTLYDIEDFLSAVKNQYVDTLLLNPMFSLQLLCVYHDRRNATMYRTESTSTDARDNDGTTESTKFSKTPTNLGKTRSHIFAYIIEMMLQNVKVTDEEAIRKLNQLYAMGNNMKNSLPICFNDQNLIYNKLANFIIHIGQLAFNCLINDTKDVISENEMETYLSLEEIDVLLGSGLLSAINTGILSSKSIMYCFLHQTYKEMLACVYLSSLSMEGKEWQMFEQKIGIKISPDILSFLCVMNYKQGCRCFDIYQAVERKFLRGCIFLVTELIDYQSCVQMAYEECRNSGIDVPLLFLKHAHFGKYSKLKLDHALLQRRYDDLELIAFINHNECQELLPIRYSKSLKCLLVIDSILQCPNVDLSQCIHLHDVFIINSQLPGLIIDPSSLTNCWISTELELKQDNSPMKVSFDSGKQFSSCLQKLSLANVIMDAPLDLLNCQNLQELHIDSVQFTENVHLDLSSHKSLSKITIQKSHLAHITINTSCLDTFSANIMLRLIEEIPPLKVSFDGMRQFSSSLQILSLGNVIMEAPLDLLQCQNLKQLYIDTFLFPVDKNLDLSGFTNLSKIIIHNNCLAHVTINPSLVDAFHIICTSMLNQEIKPMKVSFDRGSLFSSSLEELCLMNVTFDPPLDLSHCRKLQSLILDEVQFSSDTNLYLGGRVHPSTIVIRNSRLKFLTVNPSFLKTFEVMFEPEFIEKTERKMKLSFEGGCFSSKLKSLSLVNSIIVGIIQIDMTLCTNLQTMQVDRSIRMGQCIYNKLEEIRIFGRNKPQSILGSVTNLSSIFPSLKRLWFEYIPSKRLTSFMYILSSAQMVDLIGFRFICLDRHLEGFVSKCSVKNYKFENVTISSMHMLMKMVSNENIPEANYTGMDNVAMRDVCFSNCDVIGSTVDDVNSAVRELQRIWNVDVEITSIDRLSGKVSPRKKAKRHEIVRLRTLHLKAK
ncbi:uncharacterized protein LOC128204126 isoform X2 [Mya arenaria]|uniref:uncharacterized protein LOC128204126 isoform X2 n=1 Tax=Mya arenaria TaxID=6604 RepID=UPI0022DF3D31|nr:uncharacterized protein LOC128204126 isoform X2 [Mya arenaria]